MLDNRKFRPVRNLSAGSTSLGAFKLTAHVSLGAVPLKVERPYSDTAVPSRFTPDSGGTIDSIPRFMIQVAILVQSPVEGMLKSGGRDFCPRTSL